MRILYAVHVGNVDLVDWVLNNLPFPTEIIFTMTHDTFEKTKSNWSGRDVLCVENRGMDIGPFFRTLQHLQNQNRLPDIVVKLHTKSHDVARESCWSRLLDKDIILKTFAEKPWIQMICASNRIVQGLFNRVSVDLNRRLESVLK